MATTSFRRHHKVCLDAAIHHVFCQLRHRGGVRDAFAALLFAASARSDLMAAPPRWRDGALHVLDALRNLAGFERCAIRALDDWPGATGHPLAVVDSLARHLHARYRTPRFLASVWFGAETAGERDRRSWFIEHARGACLRGLSLPMVMTRRMEHAFLRTRDHVPFDLALRRAEVVGLGGSPELAAAVADTRLGEQFEHGAYWRDALAWLVRREPELEPGDAALLIAHLSAIRETAPSLIGRTVATMKRDAAERLYREHRPTPRQALAWPKSQWSDARLGEWKIIELLSTDHLLAEGRALRHCVGRYDARCHRGTSTIWSLRRADDDQPVLTIEIDPKIAAITMVRGYANRAFSDAELAVISRWAARQGLGAGGSYARDLEGRLR